VRTGRLRRHLPALDPPRPSHSQTLCNPLYVSKVQNQELWLCVANHHHGPPSLPLPTFPQRSIEAVLQLDLFPAKALVHNHGSVADRLTLLAAFKGHQQRQSCNYHSHRLTTIFPCDYTSRLASILITLLLDTSLSSPPSREVLIFTLVCNCRACCLVGMRTSRNTA
jgi:hypothetical protein